jgi:hypothetical protein
VLIPNANPDPEGVTSAENVGKKEAKSLISHKKKFTKFIKAYLVPVFKTTAVV